MARLGEFELLVLLSILRQRETPFANRVREDLKANAGRPVTRGALYRTLERLRDKGFLDWSLEVSDTPERGGHPSRRLDVTPEGVTAVQESRNILLTFLDGLDPILDER